MSTGGDRVLLHGTTRIRADRIQAGGPDPNFREPGSNTRPSGEFWTVEEHSCFPLSLGAAEDYARRKARSSGEGGPAIVTMHVPEWIVQLVLSDPAGIGSFHYRSGAVCFESGLGIAELRQAWPILTVDVKDVTP